MEIYYVFINVGTLFVRIILRKFGFNA